MSIDVFLLSSSNIDVDFVKSCHSFLNDVSAAMGEELKVIDGLDYCRKSPHIFFIASGGSEQHFLNLYEKIDGPYYLLTRQTHNSLAAAMEILAFLKEKGEKGEIIHGDIENISKKLKQIIKINTIKERIKTYRLGTTGESSWLIASRTDPEVLQTSSGMELVHFPMEELLSEIKKSTYEENQFTEQIKQHKYDSIQTERALNVYGAVRRIVDRYHLNGITIRCFDILQPSGISGCLALAILNAEGVLAACEGDSRSLVSMIVLSELTDQPVFMANPARLFPDKKEIILAHCVLPLNMPDQYKLTTHFESGLGISIAGELPIGPCTIFKCKEDFKEYFAQDGQIVENLHEGCMCRTQINVRLQGEMSYFLTKPIANHHMICVGNHKTLIDDFFASYQ